MERLKLAMSNLNLSACGYDRILKVGRTIADLAGAASITSDHISASIVRSIASSGRRLQLNGVPDSNQARVSAAIHRIQLTIFRVQNPGTKLSPETRQASIERLRVSEKFRIHWLRTR